MQGISLVSDVSGEQVAALAGGPHLQRLILSQDRSDRQLSARSIRSTTQRLASALQQVSQRPSSGCASALTSACPKASHGKMYACSTGMACLTRLSVRV